MLNIVVTEIKSFYGDLLNAGTIRTKDKQLFISNAIFI